MKDQEGVEKKSTTNDAQLTAGRPTNNNNNKRHHDTREQSDDDARKTRCHRRVSSTRSATLGMLADVASREVREAKQDGSISSKKNNTLQKPSFKKSSRSVDSGGDTTVTTTNNNKSILRPPKKLISERRGELGLKRPAGLDSATKGVLKRQRSAPDDQHRCGRPFLLTRQRSTGSHISFSDKVQIADSIHHFSSDTSSSSVTKCAHNNNRPPQFLRRGDRQQSLESLKLPSFIKMNDRQFSLESMMSFRSQESTSLQESSGTVFNTPSTGAIGRDTPTSVDTPNTARMEKFYQECCMNSSSTTPYSNMNNSTIVEYPNAGSLSQTKIVDISSSTTSSDSISAAVEPPPFKLPFRPPRQEQRPKLIAVAAARNRKEQDDNHKRREREKQQQQQYLRRAVSQKEGNRQRLTNLQDCGRSSSAPAINKPQALEGQGLRGWLDGSIGSSPPITSMQHFPQPRNYGGIPPNHLHRRPTPLTSYNNNNSNNSVSMDSRRPQPYKNHSSNNNRSSSSYIDRQSSFETNASNSHLPHYQRGCSNNNNRNYPPKKTEMPPRVDIGTKNTSVVKFGHPRSEVVEGQQIYSRHTLLLWGAHKSDVCPVGGTSQEGCDSVLIGVTPDDTKKNSISSKDDTRFAQIKCSLRNGGSALFTNYQKSRSNESSSYPIRLFRKTRGAGGLVGYRYDGLYHIMAILDDVTSKPRSTPSSDTSFRILLERNPAGQHSGCNNLTLDELWDFVQQASSPSSPGDRRSIHKHHQHQHHAPNLPNQQHNIYQYPQQEQVSSGNFMTHNNTSTMHNHNAHTMHNNTAPFSYHEKEVRGKHHYANNEKQRYPPPNIPPVPMQRKKSAEVSLLHIQYFDDDNNRPATASNEHLSYHNY